jgi:hypothetical protein
MEGMRNWLKILVRNPEEKTPLGRPRRRWKNNIKTDLRELGVWDCRLGLSASG